MFRSAILLCLFAGVASATNPKPPETPTPVVNPVVNPVISPVITPVINPVIAPVTAPVIAPRIEPVIAPVTTVSPVIAPVVAPVIAPRVDVENTNVNANANLNSNVNRQGQAQGQDQAQRQAQGQNQGQSQTATGGNATGGAATQAQDASNTNTVAPVQSLTYNEASAPANVTIRTTPNVNAPGLASAINNDLCVVSASVGGSGVGFGIGIGLQYTDTDCVRRVNARQLFNFGYIKAATLLMANDGAVRDALVRAGDLKESEVALPLGQPQKLVQTFPAVDVR